LSSPANIRFFLGEGAATHLFVEAAGLIVFKRDDAHAFTTAFDEIGDHRIKQLPSTSGPLYRLIEIYGVKLPVISDMLLGTFRTADGKADSAALLINKQERIILCNNRFPYFLAPSVIECRKIIIADDPLISRTPAVDLHFRNIFSIRHTSRSDFK